MGIPRRGILSIPKLICEMSEHCAGFFPPICSVQLCIQHSLPRDASCTMESAQYSSTFKLCASSDLVIYLVNVGNDFASKVCVWS